MASFTLADWPLNPSSGRYEGDYVPGKYKTVNGSFLPKASPTQAIVEDFQNYPLDFILDNGTWNQYQTNGGAIVKSASLPYRAGAKGAYSNWARGQFATSWRYLPVRSKKVFMSYVICLLDNYAHDYGVFKLNRITSSARSLVSGGGGGGGVYNGVGCMAFSSVKLQEYPLSSGQTSFTAVNPLNPDQNESTNVLGNSPYQNMTTERGRFIRVENYVDLGTAGNSDGRFYTRCGSMSFNDYQNQPMSSTLRDFYEDTILLGLDFANPMKWIKVNGAVVANTNYSITLTSSGITYTVNSGSSPVLTNVQIMENLYSQLSAVLPTTPGSAGVFLSPAHDEIRVGDPNNGVSHTFSSSLIYRAYGAIICDVIVDTTRSQYYVTETNTFDFSTAELLEYKDHTNNGSGNNSAIVFRTGGQLFDPDMFYWYVGEDEIPVPITVEDE